MTGFQACSSVTRFARPLRGQRIAAPMRAVCVSSVTIAFRPVTKPLLRRLALRPSKWIGMRRRVDCGESPAKPVFYTDEKNGTAPIFESAAADRGVAGNHA